MTDDTPDYTTMSGAQFARAVGADPEKWAEAFVQQYPAQVSPPDRADCWRELLATWFRAAMDAARSAAPDE